MRRLAAAHLLLGGYCAGLCLALCGTVSGTVAVLLAVAVIVALGVAGGGARRLVMPGAAFVSRHATVLMLTVIFILTGYCVGAARLQAVGESVLQPHTGHTLSLVVEVTGLPKADERSLTVPVKVVEIDGQVANEPSHLQLAAGEDGALMQSWTGMSEGLRLRVPAARVEALPEPRRGEFDYARYLRRRGEHVALSAALFDIEVAGRRSGCAGLTDALRRAAREHLRHGLSSDLIAVLQGMVLGDDQAVDEGAVEDFRRSGLLHIMAVSGENVVLLCAMWSFALSLLRVPRNARTLLLVPIVICYVVITGASPSIVRAGVAGVLGLLAILASRPSDGWLLWLAPGAWLLTANPNNLFDVSFQLSFAAVAGLLLISRPLTRAFAFLPESVAEQVGVTTAASIATAPVSMITFGSASVVSVAANVAGGFVLGPIMFFGMLSVLLGFAWSAVCIPLNVGAGVFIGFLLAVARFFGDLPWAVYEWRGLTLVAAVTVVAGSWAALLTGLSRRAGEGVVAYARGRLATIVPSAVVCLAVVLLVVPPPAGPPTVATITILDVGQGSATLVQVPGGPTVLIDAGPKALAATLRDHAVKSIELLVISHGHDDHIGGLADVIGAIPIAAAVLPRPPSPSAALEDLRARLGAAGCRVSDCTAAFTVSGAGLVVSVLPTSARDEGGNQGENDCALVAMLRVGALSVLAPGDAEGEALAALSLPAVAVVELPHHGSAGGLDERLLDELSPRLAVISVGADNRFGHPSAQTVALLAAGGVPTLRTDQVGDIVLTAAAGQAGGEGGQGGDGMQVSVERTR